MNLTQYKEKKQKELQSFNAQKRRVHCLECMRPQKACLCHHIEPFETQTQFCILMHPMEAKKESVGTGRYTNKCLKNCRIIVGESFDEDKEVQKILKDESLYPMILYPGESSINISTTKINRDDFKGKTPLIFVIDGTWPCAKSMMRDSKSLHDLPRVSFDNNEESKFSIKHQPAKYCLSTIESVYKLISELEKQGLENVGAQKETMPHLLSELVKFQIKCANDPALQTYKRKRSSYKSPSERKNAKRWEQRKICFEDKNYS